MAEQPEMVRDVARYILRREGPLAGLRAVDARVAGIDATWTYPGVFVYEETSPGRDRCLCYGGGVLTERTEEAMPVDILGEHYPERLMGRTTYTLEMPVHSFEWKLSAESVTLVLRMQGRRLRARAAPIKVVWSTWPTGTARYQLDTPTEVPG